MVNPSSLDTPPSVVIVRGILLLLKSIFVGVFMMIFVLVMSLDVSTSHDI